MVKIDEAKLKNWLIQQDSLGNWAFRAEEIATGLGIRNKSIKELELALEKIKFLSTHENWLPKQMKDSHPGEWRFLISVPARIEWGLQKTKQKLVWEP